MYPICTHAKKQDACVDMYIHYMKLSLYLLLSLFIIIIVIIIIFILKYYYNYILLLLLLLLLYMYDYILCMHVIACMCVIPIMIRFWVFCNSFHQDTRIHFVASRLPCQGCEYVCYKDVKMYCNSCNMITGSNCRCVVSECGSSRLFSCKIAQDPCFQVSVVQYQRQSSAIDGKAWTRDGSARMLPSAQKAHLLPVICTQTGLESEHNTCRILWGYKCSRL